jgi:hypothetical protein
MAKSVHASPGTTRDGDKITIDINIGIMAGACSYERPAISFEC